MEARSPRSPEPEHLEPRSPRGQTVAASGREAAAVRAYRRLRRALPVEVEPQTSAGGLARFLQLRAKGN
jgi:hypothetical protein